MARVIQVHIPGAYQAAVHAMKIAKQYNCTIVQEPGKGHVRTYFVGEEADYIMLKLARPDIIKSHD